MSHISNPTANAAIGNIDREIRRAQEAADVFRAQIQKGEKPDKAAIDAVRRSFVGIFRCAFDTQLKKPFETDGAAPSTPPSP